MARKSSYNEVIGIVLAALVAAGLSVLLYFMIRKPSSGGGSHSGQDTCVDCLKQCYPKGGPGTGSPSQSCINGCISKYGSKCTTTLAGLCQMCVQSCENAADPYTCNLSCVNTFGTGPCSSIQ